MVLDFMGEEERIKKIYRKYVKYFSTLTPVLDIGCGRGIFLELLRENNISGIGVDLSVEYVKYCQNKGLNVIKDELLSFLRSSSNDHYGGIFAAHIIEHFYPEQALELIRHSHRILKPEGIMVIITPNTKDLGVITENFWLDISHKRPYPLILLERLLEEVGFKIIDKGEDVDTQPKVKVSLKSVLKKIRFGEFINRGDYFIIGKKT